MKDNYPIDEKSGNSATGDEPAHLIPKEDGRNEEWQDRARVNLKQTTEGIHTSVERDFEPENLEENGDKTGKSTTPAY